MAFVSVTRLHLRSKLFFPPFALYTFRSARQAKRSRGFRDGMLGGDGEGGAWTITAWDSEGDMRDFRSAGAHRAAMPKLLRWCDEASFTHYESDTGALPDSAEAYRRMQSAGRLSKVNKPSPAHASGRTVSASVPRFGLRLKRT